MHALLRFVPTASVVMLALACGGKGDDPAPEETSNDGAGGSDSSNTNSDSGNTSGPAEAMLVYGFETGLDGWIPQYTSSEEEDALIAVDDLDIAWNESGGSPDGALQADIPYSAPSQWIGYGVSLSASVDLTNRIISADVMIQSGVGEPDDLMQAPAGAKLYVKSGDAYVYAAGQYNNITTIGEWTTIYFDVAFPDYVDEANGLFDPADIRELGIQFDTNGETTTAAPGTWLVDNIKY